MAVEWTPAMADALLLYGTDSIEFRDAFRDAAWPVLLAEITPEQPDPGDTLPDQPNDPVPEPTEDA